MDIIVVHKITETLVSFLSITTLFCNWCFLEPTPQITFFAKLECFIFIPWIHQFFWIWIRLFLSFKKSLYWSDVIRPPPGRKINPPLYQVAFIPIDLCISNSLICQENTFPWTKNRTIIFLCVTLLTCDIILINGFLSQNDVRITCYKIDLSSIKIFQINYINLGDAQRN